MLQAIHMTLTESKQEKYNHLFPAGIEPATSPVWRVRDNHYTKETLAMRTELPGKIVKIVQSKVADKLPGF